MALAGCTGVFIGFGSLSDDNLTAAHKKIPKTSDYARRVRVLHDYGIQVNGSFVLGFDHDRQDVFVRTADWIEENRLECATFHILTPYPATPLFHQMDGEGRLLHRNWDLYDTGHAVFQLKHMSPEELERGYADLSPAFFARVNLEASAGTVVCSAGSPCDLVLVQALKPAVAPLDQARPGARAMEPAARVYSRETRPLSQVANGREGLHWGNGKRGRRGCLAATSRTRTPPSSGPGVG